MSDRIERYRRQQAIKKASRQNPRLPALIDVKSVKADSLQKADTHWIDSCLGQLEETYRIDWNELSVSDDDVQGFMDQFNDKEAAIEALIEPAFLSLIDGSMRSFKLGSKQGLTATRIYNECKFFSYDQTKYVDPKVDRFTEYLNEEDNRKSFGSTSKYNGGVFSRDGEKPLSMRDQPKMNIYKENYFAGHDTAEDEYSPGEKVFKDSEAASYYMDEGWELPEGKEPHHYKAETDHIIPCKTLCEELKSNKALNPNDIRAILNDDENFAVTSFDTNRGIGGKFDKTNEEWVGKHGENLSPGQRETMLQKSQEARATINTKTNKTVFKNVATDKKVQSRLAEGAAAAAGHRAIGDAIIFFIKPLHFELKDCLMNGIENGVNASDFKDALKKRTGRMSAYIEKNIKGMFQGGIQNFIKSFFSMLIEGILNCFVGIFKHIVRAVSEGIRIFIQAIPILNDNTRSAAEKGDAILKIVAFSSTALVGIGIEALLNKFVISEPWSIIAASVISTVIMALVMYVLEKIDLFNLKHEARRARIMEALELLKRETDEALNDLIDPGKKFMELNPI